MSFQLLELTATALGDLRNEVVFVGGATLPLWITNTGAPPVRPTNDVDVIVQVTTRTAFYNFEKKLRIQGFSEDSQANIICRWKHHRLGLTLDAIPLTADIFGFVSHWQQQGTLFAQQVILPSSTTIRAIAPPFLLATKIEAFKNRGRGDFLMSHDFHDLISVIDGREELLDEISQAPKELKKYLATELDLFTKNARFTDAVYGAMQPDSASQERADLVVLPRVQTVISLCSSS